MADTTSRTAPAGQSLTLAVAHVFADALRGMNEADDAHTAAAAAAQRGDDGANIRANRLEAEGDAHYRRLEAAHALMPHLPVATIEEAAVVALHAMGYLDDILNNEDAVARSLPHALAGFGAVARFLVREAGLDFRAMGGTYLVEVRHVDPGQEGRDDGYPDYR